MDNRDCSTCIHHSEKGCSSWDCKYEKVRVENMFYKLKIFLRNGEVDTWGSQECTEYEYKGDIFVVINKARWVGIYNMKNVIKIVVSKENK